MKIAVYSRVFKVQDQACIQELFDVLYQEKIEVVVLLDYLSQIKSFIKINSDIPTFSDHIDLIKLQPDILLSVGGDGTMLGATTYVRDSGIPILGLNLGRLGFLASLESKHLRQSISQLRKGIYTIDERTLLQLESNMPLFDGITFALNDCTILKRDTSSMVRINTYINGSFLNSYWADGLIISTPTGSTGYSLSCGGPIIFPDSGNFVITPVAPHNLNVRPIVISDNSVISFEVEGRAETFLLTLDSRFESITSQHQLAVRKCDFCIKTVTLNDNGFMQTIREKLDWGKDARN
ncbi:MAG: NAD kinase [Saprospiraceae bacterium]|jgi:NAD+ kinase|nr:NAD kinase [Saprospiraceae bacterium]